MSADVGIDARANHMFYLFWENFRLCNSLPLQPPRSYSIKKPYSEPLAWESKQEARSRIPARSVQGSGFRVQGFGFRVSGLGFRVQGSGLRA